MAEATQEPSQREIPKPKEIVGEGSEINKILTSPGLTPKKLVDVLKESFNLRELYKGSVGVWEGYSLEEHALMVMGQFERYFSSEWDSSLVSKEHFRLMLALHDLGKPQALRETNSVIKQHEYTMRMIPGILQQAGLDQREIDIIKGIINQDFLGDYVRNRQSLDMTAKLISERAQQVGVPATEFMNLLRIYYMCDAGSYTEDAGGKRSLDALFIFDREKGKMGVSPALQDKFDKLLGSLEFQKVSQGEMEQAAVQVTPKKEISPEVAKKQQFREFIRSEEQPRMSPSVHYERDAVEFYPQAIEAVKNGDNDILRKLIPKVFPVRPLIPDTKSIYHGVMPYLTAGEPGGATFLRRSQGRLMSPREYVQTLQRIQEDGLKSPDRDQLFSDRNIRGLYFVDRPEVTWGVLYVEAPLSIEYPYAYVETKEGPKPVFKGIMRGMTYIHGNEFVVYSYSNSPLRAILRVGLKPPKDVHEKLPHGYYNELQKEFRKAFAKETVSE